MKYITVSKWILFIFISSLCFQFLNAQEIWEGQWITAIENQSESNTWICFRKEFNIQKTPLYAPVKIAVDSKYWLWVNGEMLVFEGGLKRGPTPMDTYYDEVDIAPYLNEGENVIAILLWYFGKDGFSHNSSGSAAMAFECNTSDLKLFSDKSWKAMIHPAYEQMTGIKPNYRLPESNIRFDSRRDLGDWYALGYSIEAKGFRSAVILGKPPVCPWNDLVKRPIPLWKDYGLKEYESVTRIPGSINDTLVCRLPYNAQITPWLKVQSEEGKLISIQTDHYFGGGPPNVRAEYITSNGVHEYESFGWMNGQKVFYIIPKELELIEVNYRETGFNTDFSGLFTCNDLFLNKLWDKAVRTLYLTMRDTYMDCPDRERSQWWGDMVNESGEAFYALSPSSASLTKKGILELIHWQRPDSTLFSPIPSGNWNKELPGQMLASVGYYGFWNYYLNSGDRETIEEVYEGVKRYLEIWRLKENGTLIERKGNWYWGDWGEKVDKELLINSWYYLALKGFRNMSKVLGKNEEVNVIQNRMNTFQDAYNQVFWNGQGYRTIDYEGKYDDRAQALAVVSGLADNQKYPQLLEIFKTSFLASPYMEKYVVEALFLMDQPEYGIERLKSRFNKMVLHPEITTLWEGWDIGKEGYGGGSINHAWSGCGLTIMSQYIAGISPLDPAYTKFQVKPQMADLKNVAAIVPSVNGRISLELEKNENAFMMNIDVPPATQALIHIPSIYTTVTVNSKTIINKGKFVKHPLIELIERTDQDFIFEFKDGKYNITAE